MDPARSSPFRHPAVRALRGLALAILAGSPAASLAQQPSSPPAPPAPSTGTVEFAQDPLKVDAVGLSMLLPLGAKAETNTVGSKSTVQIRPKDATWLINIQTPRTGNAETTAAAAVDEIVTQIMKEAGEVYEKDTSGPRPKGVLVGYKGAILEPRHTVVIHEKAAERVYLKLPDAQGTGAVVRGFTVFKTSPTQFVTFELLAPEAAFARARAVYETTVGTAEFEDPSKLGADRLAAITAGLKVFERVTESDVRAIIEAQPERWERLYRPAVTGSDADATELGYRRIRLSVGTRADLDPKAAPNAAGARTQGFLARLDARFLDKAVVDNGRLSAGRIIDSQSIYFMSFDRADEAWAVQNAVRAPSPNAKPVPKVFSETGGRTGKSLFVSVTAPGESPRAVRPMLQGEGYISRFEGVILPSILIRSGITADLGFYAYQSDSETIRLRRDILERPTDIPGAWRLTTRLSEDKKAQASLYNEKGDFIRTEMPDGSRWEPVTLDQLVRLWKSKGLPMD